MEILFYIFIIYLFQVSACGFYHMTVGTPFPETITEFLKLTCGPYLIYKFLFR